MMRAALCAFALFALGCQSRTEIVLGVITDLTAPDALDRVHLEVHRTDAPPGSDPLLEQDWSIPGVPDQPFILPGSFGLYSSDGSEPRVKILITGFRGNEATPRVTRTSILSLISGQTLFLRQSLVAGCVANTDCLDSGNQTCVEGRCVDNRIDTHTLPTFAPSLLDQVQCGSTLFLNTGSGATITPSGSCGAGQFCQEGLCYTPPMAFATAAVWHALSSGTSADLNAIATVPAPVDGTTVLVAVGAHGAAVRLGEVFAPAGDSGWVAETTGATDDLFGAWGADVHQVFAVGARGAIWSRDETGAWSPMTSGTTEDLHAVWGTSATDVWAVGGSHGAGVALHFDGASWAPQTLPSVGELRGVGGLPTGELWLAGRGGALLHSTDGRIFSAVASAPGAGENLTSVWASAGAVYVTSSSGALFASLAQAPFAAVDLGGNSNPLFSVTGFPSGDVYAVGNGGAIFHAGPSGQFTAQYSDLPEPLAAVGGASAQDVFAVGAGGTLLHSGALPNVPDGSVPTSPDLSMPVTTPDLGPAACSLATTSTLAANGNLDLGGTPLASPSSLVYDGVQYLYALTANGLTRVDTTNGSGQSMAVAGANVPDFARLGADSGGNLYAVEPAFNVVLRLTPNAGGFDALFLAGGSAGFTDGANDVAQFQGPMAISCDAATSCYVADQGNFAIRVVDQKTGMTSTLAGNGTGGNVDGTGTRNGTARFGGFADLSIDRTTSILYVADAGNLSIRAVATDGTVSTAAQSAAFSIAADGVGHVLFVQNDILFLFAGGGVAPLAGGVSGMQDGDGCTAQFNGLYGVAASPAGGQVWLSEQGNNDIRAVTF